MRLLAQPELITNAARISHWRGWRLKDSQLLFIDTPSVRQMFRHCGKPVLASVRRSGKFWRWVDQDKLEILWREYVRIHAIGFPVYLDQPNARIYRFAALMRELAYRNDGTFVGLTEYQ